MSGVPESTLSDDDRKEILAIIDAEVRQQIAKLRRSNYVLMVTAGILGCGCVAAYWWHEAGLYSIIAVVCLWACDYRARMMLAARQSV